MVSDRRLRHDLCTFALDVGGLIDCGAKCAAIIHQILAEAVQLAREG